MGDAVTGGRNAGWSTSKSGRPCPRQNCSHVRLQWIASGACQKISSKIDKGFQLFGEFFHFQCENPCFLRVFISRLKMHARCRVSRGFGCDVRTIWGHTQLFESLGICIMSQTQESEVRVPFGVGSWKKKSYLTDFVCSQPQCFRPDGLTVEFSWEYLKHFKRKLSRYKVYRGYIVLGGTITYSGLAPMASRTGRRGKEFLLNHPSCHPDDPIGGGTDLTGHKYIRSLPI